MNHSSPDVEARRRFIKNASVFALTLPAIAPASSYLRCEPVENFLDAQRPSLIEIAGRQEAGIRILLHGTIYDPDGDPLPNVKMFLYQTDATGYYCRPVNNPRRARLQGTVWSNAQGQYSFGTIKPAHYADVDPPPPMHIHVHLEPPNLPEHWVDSYYFEGDPHLRPEAMARAHRLGRFSNVVRLASGELNVMKGLRDFRIDQASATRNKLINGWYRQ